MYLLFGIFLLLFLFILNHWRKKRILGKICNMSMTEKCELLNELIMPFGYSYILSQDMFTSRTDTWQQGLRHYTVSEKTFSHTGMVFDILPVYFNYADQTWLIEFWKGQYGIKTCGGIGIYYADRILSKQEQRPSRFQSADKESIRKLSFSFYENKTKTIQLSAKHSWLAAFKPGHFSMPSDLSMQISLSFPSFEMAKSFAEGLVDTGYPCDDVCIYRHTVRFTFDTSVSIHNPFLRLRSRTVQYCNYWRCRVYCFITRFSHLSVDKVLYLYYYLPFIFPKILRLPKFTYKT